MNANQAREISNTVNKAFLERATMDTAIIKCCREGKYNVTCVSKFNETIHKYVLDTLRKDGFYVSFGRKSNGNMSYTIRWDLDNSGKTIQNDVIISLGELAKPKPGGIC